MFCVLDLISECKLYVCGVCVLSSGTWCTLILYLVGLRVPHLRGAREGGSGRVERGLGERAGRLREARRKLCILPTKVSEAGERGRGEGGGEGARLMRGKGGVEGKRAGRGVRGGGGRRGRVWGGAP